MSLLEIKKRLDWIEEQPKEKQFSLRNRLNDKGFWSYVQQSNVKT